MNQNEFYILNNLYNASVGRAQVTSDLTLSRAVKDQSAYRGLVERGWIDASTGEITDRGLQSLEPYRVDNAVILAAGSATRFIPLSLEQPKGLYEVKGEKLIERQIQQLQEAGIRDITVVLGYKQEMFFFLREKYGVKYIFNPLYNVKNNIESLLLARQELKNSYVCACDSYFVENPFNRYEYRSFYAGYSTEKQEDEMYVRIDMQGRIVCMKEALAGGLMLLGHSFWTREFSQRFVSLAEEDREIGKYDNDFWEWMVKDRLTELPPIYFKEYASGCIHEFDTFEQLREFDTDYIGHTRSEIIRNIKLVFRCDEDDIVDFRTVKEGLTNTSFIFRIDGEDYIYRHPGDGTERIINRRNEKQSLIIAKQFGIDPTYIYMDINEGWKISRLVKDFREPAYESFDDSKRIIALLRRLHKIPVKVDYGLRPWEDALTIERLLKDKEPGCFAKYEALKRMVEKLYQKTINDGVERCFCHGDTYKPNWMLKDDGTVILIDWEYSGYTDPGVDIGYYIVDAGYEIDEAKRFIREYLQDSWSERREFHFLAYTAIIAYYWFVWALYRESCGAVIGESLEHWRSMAERVSGKLTAEGGGE